MSTSPALQAATRTAQVSHIHQATAQRGVNSANILNPEGFDFLQRVANALASSDLVPTVYRKQTVDRKGNVSQNPSAIANTIVAVNMATRMNADPLMVMQNLYIIEGRPSWSSQWIIAMINGCGKFSPLRFDMSVSDIEEEVPYTETSWENGSKQVLNKKQKIKNMSCVAWAIEKETGERLESPRIDLKMAVVEGWYNKNGSKWKTMPEMMLRYRSASFFGKVYSPELLMGLMTVEESQDIIQMEELNGEFVAAQRNTSQSPAFSAASVVDVVAPTGTVESVDDDGVISVEPTESQDEDHPDSVLHAALMSILECETTEDLLKATPKARKMVKDNAEWLARLNEDIAKRDAELTGNGQQNILV